MKRIVLVLFAVLFLVGCESESVETQPQALTIPEWLKGNYEGVHTKENLVISNQKITFKQGFSCLDIDAFYVDFIVICLEFGL